MPEPNNQHSELSKKKSAGRMAPSAISLICGLVAFSSTVDMDQIRSIQR
jgi:hypothetical protein